MIGILSVSILESLWGAAAGLEQHGIFIPVGSLSRTEKQLISCFPAKNEDRVLLQKTVTAGAIQIVHCGLVEQYLYTGSHKAIFDKISMAV